MDRKTVRGIYDNGDLRFAEPVNVAGCWKVEITFVEQEDEASIPLEANPHGPELLDLHGNVIKSERHSSMEAPSIPRPF